MRVQLTHTLDFSGASIFAVVAGLDSAYHVCAAPLTLQELFDRLARRKVGAHRPPPACGRRGQRRGAGRRRAFFSAAKLEREGLG